MNKDGSGGRAIDTRRLATYLGLAAESNTRRLAVANRVMWWLDLLVGMVAMGWRCDQNSTER